MSPGILCIGWCLVFKASKSYWFNLPSGLHPGVYSIYSISMGEKTTTSSTTESCLAPSIAQADVVSQNSSPNSELVDEVFSPFRGYLNSQLQEKGKQFEQSAKSDKEAADIKYKGNRKQFEVNLRLYIILTQIDESAGSPADIHKLVAEARLIIKKRQKLIKIADKNRDGWLVVQEYETDDLASDSEDEKKIRKAKAAAEKKRKEAKSNMGNTSKKFKSSSDVQLFRGKTTIYFYFVKFSVFLVGLPEHPTINLLCQVIYYDFKRKIIYARLSVAN